jgi:hypothetical protein
VASMTFKGRRIGEVWKVSTLVNLAALSLRLWCQNLPFLIDCNLPKDHAN